MTQMSITERLAMIATGRHLDLADIVAADAKAEIERLQQECARLASERACFEIDVRRLRTALEAIKTLKPLEPIGAWGDPYAEMTVSAIGIAVNALAGHPLGEKA
jgi:hypothetical protein